MKKALKSAVVLLVVLSLALCGSLAAFADEYGTKEDGITSGSSYSNQHKVTPTDSFKNGDFSEGLRYWTTDPPNTKASQFVALKSEGGANYVTLTPRAGQNWDGIVSTRFFETRLKAGDRPIVVYDWRSENPEQLQIYLGQALLDAEGASTNGNEVRLSNGGSQAVPIISAASPQEWSTSMTLSVKEIQVPNRGNDAICLFAGIQTYRSDTVKADIKNLRLGFYDKAEGKIYDLDGNVMYDLKEINAEEAKGFYKYEDPFSFSHMEKNFSKGGSSTTEKSSFSLFGIKLTTIIILILVLIVVLILGAAAAIVIIVVAKKKKKALPAEEAPEIQEEVKDNE